MSSEEYDSESSYEEWTDSFLKTFNTQLLGRVDKSYIKDSFNLYGLQDQVKEYDRSIRILRGDIPNRYTQSEKTLYYMIHQRYILTNIGLSMMYKLIDKEVYGKCLRISCSSFPLLPVGLSDHPEVSNTKLYCFSCKELYESFGELSKIDGCAFGKTFAHLFTLLYKDCFYVSKKEQPKYTPRIFGFLIE